MKPESNIDTPEQAIIKLKKGNEEFITSNKSNADVSVQMRVNTAQHGQKPYAVILTCSDSRVPAEYIFSAGIGELFIIRTAGNVVSGFEIGSIEYGVKHLGAKVVVVMGHNFCGAVAAALEEGQADGYIADIVEEVRNAIGTEKDLEKAEDLNIAHSYGKILKSTIVTELVRSKKVVVIQAKYDINTGIVKFFR